MEEIILKRYSSPAGELELASYGDALVMCDWTVMPRHGRVLQRIRTALRCGCTEGTSSVIEMTIRELEEYFRGERKCFDIPLLLVGTDLQKRVWQALLSVGYGRTESYSQVAEMVGSPRAVRPVASAVGANPVSILVPCHRIISKGGSLTGYAGGLPAKRILLSLESSCLE